MERHLGLQHNTDKILGLAFFNVQKEDQIKIFSS